MMRNNPKHRVIWFRTLSDGTLDWIFSLTFDVILHVACGMINGSIQSQTEKINRSHDRKYDRNKTRIELYETC